MSSASLVGHTVWLGETYTGGDLTSVVAECARVSNPTGVRKSSNEKLLKYLIKHKHWSPLEMANVVLDISTTRDIARQLLRHDPFPCRNFRSAILQWKKIRLLVSVDYKTQIIDRTLWNVKMKILKRGGKKCNQLQYVWVLRHTTRRLRKVLLKNKHEFYLLRDLLLLGFLLMVPYVVGFIILK